ncbi:hypothetical protein MTY66_64180 (plasmid) [Mycolicibacterium sp. TY66]|uniref:SHOCT domain-containing protein n=1 Tax=unclassified Mycolicibacterium TaxID=2636767 RepID=UPI001BB2F9E6|nr:MULTISPECIES: SHOCT domain-containing protein [unclassified Mycolicibacterium]BCI84793.1 hypothetical protein MTY66_64180 [Mycolicibacterium sp. TY66]BCJ85006.1 hypothetical protein MTY81_63790 [Mycolicibacterium sp. TY81]
METTRLTYIGPPAHASALAQELENLGLAVKYRPPIEAKDLATALAAVSVLLAATGPVSNVVSGVQRFLKRFPGTRVEGLPVDQSPLDVQERLARIDELKASGTITADEHAEQRARILREL